MASILVIGGNDPQSEALATELTQNGHAIVEIARGADGLRRVRDARPDLVIVDQALEDMPGTDLVRTIRSDSVVRAVPIVMVSDRDEEIDRVVAFEVGVDDFVTKPYSIRELSLRIRAILRRRRRDAELVAVSAVGGLRLDPVAHRVTVADEEVALSALEFKLLATLYRRRSRVQTREELLEEVWGSRAGVSVRTVDACIKRLRHKLDDAGSYVQTVRGVGYRFIAPDEIGLDD